MTEYIPLQKKYYDGFMIHEVLDEFENDYNTLLAMLNRFASMDGADVVEAVRCGECKWFKLSEFNKVGIHICGRFSGVRGVHDFCSRGERKEVEIE